MEDDDVTLTWEQRRHWDSTYAEHVQMYGSDPSEAAQLAASILPHGDLLELGAGQGRDALFFAQNGFRVNGLDFSSVGLKQAEDVAQELGLADRFSTITHDVGRPLPFADETFNGVFAHMLLTMALSTAKINELVAEVGRVLRPGGAFVYTVRNTSDAHFGEGRDHGDNIYEHGGFAVHFFDEQLVSDLSDGWEFLRQTELEEGELPRRLWWIAQRK